MNIKNLRYILIAIPFSMLFVYLIRRFEKEFSKNLPDNKKFGRIAIMSIIVVVIGFILAINMFNKDKDSDKIIKYSLIIGSSFIFINSILFHWSQLTYNTKLAIIVTALLLKVFFLSVIKDVKIIFNEYYIN
jgi:hypothetical protein